MVTCYKRSRSQHCALTLLVLFAGASPSSAQVCPDFHEYNKILEEGTQKAEGGTTGQIRSSPRRDLIHYPEVFPRVRQRQKNSYGSDWAFDDYFTSRSDADDLTDEGDLTFGACQTLFAERDSEITDSIWFKFDPVNKDEFVYSALYRKADTNPSKESQLNKNLRDAYQSFQKSLEIRRKLNATIDQLSSSYEQSYEYMSTYCDVQSGKVPDRGYSSAQSSVNKAKTVIDLLKCAVIEEHFGDSKTAKRLKKEAVLICSETANSTPLTPVYLASIFAELKQNDLPQVRNNIEEHLLKSYSDGAVLLMRAYAMAGQEEDTLRMYEYVKSKGLKNALPDLRCFHEHCRTCQDSRNAVIGESLESVGAWQQACDHYEDWLKKVYRISHNKSEPAYINLSLARARFKNHEEESAVQSYKNAVNIAALESAVLPSVKLDILDAIENDLKSKKGEGTIGGEPDVLKANQSAKVQAQALQDELNEANMKAQCLQLATKLSKTGWRLEQQGQIADAIRMYKSALEIKVKNLGLKALPTAEQQVELGRALSTDGKWKEASRNFEQATNALRESRDPAKWDHFKTALELYAESLSHSNPEKAETIYSELRKMR